MYDILLIGATGFTGKLIIQYLLAHPRRSTLTLAITARGNAKLQNLAKAYDLDEDVGLIDLDVTREQDVETAVRQTRVVINAVGPFWLYGTPIVRACARLGVHYVDITAETAWVQHIIDQYDYNAYKTGAIIVPSCGLESVPSDLCVYLGYNKLRELVGSDVRLGYSMTVSHTGNQVSSGTARTMITMPEMVPKEVLQTVFTPYSLSPLQKDTPRSFFSHICRQLPYVRPAIYGSFHLFSLPNIAIVQRTWGVLQNQKISDVAYGPDFVYEEYGIARSMTEALANSFLHLLVMVLIMFIAPARWILERILTPAGGGPSEKTMQSTLVTFVNVTSSAPSGDGSRQRHVKTTIQFKGDGYVLSSVTASEAALALLSPSTISPIALGLRGGIFTPASALGDSLINALQASGRAEIMCEEVGDKER